MLIDWFTVAAQILNFLVLVALLKYFLYRPILGLMDKREQAIAARLQEAEAASVQAEHEAGSYRSKNAKWGEEYQALLAGAKRDIETLRQELVAKARNEFVTGKARWRDALLRDKAAFRHELRNRMIEQLYAIARHALADLATTSLEAQVIEVFLARLHALGTEQRAALSASLQRPDQKVLIRSAFEIPPRSRDEMIQAVRDTVAPGTPVQFERSPDVICGIELRTPGYKLGWSLAQYVDRLEEAVVEALDDVIAEGPATVAGH